MEPILVAPDLDRNIRIGIDTSDYSTRKVLLIEYNNGQ